MRGVLSASTLPIIYNSRINGNITIACAILKIVAAFAAETGPGGLFVNMQETRVKRRILGEVGILQLTTPLISDNITAINIVHCMIKRQIP